MLQLKQLQHFSFIYVYILSLFMIHIYLYQQEIRKVNVSDLLSLASFLYPSPSTRTPTLATSLKPCCCVCPELGLKTQRSLRTQPKHNHSLLTVSLSDCPEMIFLFLASAVNMNVTDCHDLIIARHGSVRFCL